MIFLGVDGGGTKSSLVLINENAEVLARNETSNCYYLSVGKEKARKVILDGIREICDYAGCSPDDIDYAFLGLPTYGEISRDIQWLDDLPQPLLKKGRYKCNNDMVCGWAASLGCSDGINIVAGTGSICYGENKGVSARNGGWGELFSDEGSAYWIGYHTLNIFSKMADNRIQKGILYDIIRAKFDLKLDLDISNTVFNKWSGGRSNIASVAYVAYEAATQGDTESRKIFFNAARELALIVDSTRHSLGYTLGDLVDVSYSGGVFKCGNLILEPFVHELSRLYGHYRVLKPKYNPNIGAALYAAKLNGTEISDSDLKKLAIN